MSATPSIGLAAGTPDGIQGVVVYMAIYLAMTLGAFACILGLRRGDLMFENIDDSPASSVRTLRSPSASP